MTTAINVPTDARGFSKWLVEHKVCSEGRKWAEGKDLRTFWDTCENGEWLMWLLNASGYRWPREARAEYERVTDAAWADYQSVTALALAEYDRVTAPAWDEYERVKDAAWAEYQRVKADAVRRVVSYPFGR